MKNKIDIRCKGSINLSLEELVPFQGELKSLSKANHDKLRKQIIELGFSEPICVWNNDGKYNILNGHQRLKVLTDMRLAEGYEIPALPCVEVEADSEYQAKKKVLALTSQFGEITSSSLFEFAAMANIDLPSLDDFRFPEIDLDKFKAEFFDMPLESDKDGAKELNESDFSEFEHTCPKCGFEFNGNAKTQDGPLES